MDAWQLSAADMYLSCMICQNTLSNVYSEPSQSEGLRQDGKMASNRKISRLWLTECAHITCTEHLEGGGKPVSFSRRTLTSCTERSFQVFLFSQNRNHRRLHVLCAFWKRVKARQEGCFPLLAPTRATMTVKFQKLIFDHCQYSLIALMKGFRLCRYAASIAILAFI